MASPRTIARLESRVRERAAHALEFEIADPRAGFVTVTRVELSKDMATGRIFYSVLGTRSDKSKVAHMLASASGYLQRQIGRALKVRRIPHLNWVFDESIEEAARMDGLIKSALDRDRRINEADQDDGQAPGADPESDD